MWAKIWVFAAVENVSRVSKKLHLAEKREAMREGLAYVTGDCHSKESHWHAKYLRVEDPASLPINRKAVEATFFRTEK